MCIVSAVMDNFNNQDWKKWFPQNPKPSPVDIFEHPGLTFPPLVTREEFESLKTMVEELKNVLIAAKIYDEKTGQPDCEMEEKTKLFKRLAELCGVDISSIFVSDG